LPTVFLKGTRRVGLPKRTGMVDSIKALAIPTGSYRRDCSLDRGTGIRFIEPRQGAVQILFHKVTTDPFPFEPFGNFSGDTASGEGVDERTVAVERCPMVGMFGHRAGSLSESCGRPLAMNPI